MGYEARVTMRMGGEQSQGTLRLETRELLFRGPVRLRIPLAGIERVTADSGLLTVRFGGRVAEFELGASAPRWALRITNPPSRLDKLGVKPGMRVVAAGIPDPHLAAEITQRGASLVTLASARAVPVDLIFHPAMQRSALDRLSGLKACIKPAGAIWVVRPKGSPMVTESETMTAGKRAGLVDVKVVSFSDAYTAEKFVIPLAARGTATKSRASARPARGVRRGLR